MIILWYNQAQRFGDASIQNQSQSLQTDKSCHIACSLGGKKKKVRECVGGEDGET